MPVITHKIPGCPTDRGFFPGCSNSGSFVDAASIWFPVSQRHTPLHVGAQPTAQSTGWQAFALIFSTLIFSRPGTRVMRLDPADGPPPSCRHRWRRCQTLPLQATDEVFAPGLKPRADPAEHGRTDLDEQLSPGGATATPIASCPAAA